MHRYKYIIFDVDDTLLDFGCAYRTAQKEIAGKLGLALTADYTALDDRCGWRAWRECRLDETDDSEVQENYHVFYMQYIRNHYIYLLQELDIAENAAELAECYIRSTAASAVLMEPETLQVYAALAEHFRLVLATNGIERIQKPRISAFLPYTDTVFISEAIGCIKPVSAFYSHILQKLGCCPEECLMVGDSVTNDMAGAKRAGMDVCWYNRKKKEKPDFLPPDHEIDSIRCLPEILLPGR